MDSIQDILDCSFDIDGLGTIEVYDSPVPIVPLPSNIILRYLELVSQLLLSFQKGESGNGF